MILQGSREGKWRNSRVSNIRALGHRADARCRRVFPMERRNLWFANDHATGVQLNSLSDVGTSIRLGAAFTLCWPRCLPRRLAIRRRRMGRAVWNCARTVQLVKRASSRGVLGRIGAIFCSSQGVCSKNSPDHKGVFCEKRPELSSF